MTLDRAYGGMWVEEDSQAIRIIDANAVDNGPGSGRQFIASHHESSVAAAGVVELVLQTGANEVTMGLIGSVSGQADFQLFEDTTFSDAGSTVTPVCRDRANPLTSTVTVTHTPTLTADGTQLVEVILPGGTRVQAVGSLTFGPQSWILAPSKVYMLRIENTAATTETITLAVDLVDAGAS